MIGQGKQWYELDLIQVKLNITQGSDIALNVLVMILGFILSFLPIGYIFFWSTE